MRFIFVDEILEMVPGRTILASKKISANEEFFKDHFPGFPVVPGVLLTEMMAQTAGKCLDAEKKTRGKAMLTKIQGSTFRRWMIPDQTAKIYAEISTNRDQYAIAACYIKVEGKKICSAELFFTFLPMDNLSPDFCDKVLDDYFLKNKTNHWEV